MKDALSLSCLLYPPRLMLWQGLYGATPDLFRCMVGCGGAYSTALAGALKSVCISRSCQRGTPWLLTQSKEPGNLLQVPKARAINEETSSPFMLTVFHIWRRLGHMRSLDWPTSYAPRGLHHVFAATDNHSFHK